MCEYANIFENSVYYMKNYEPIKHTKLAGYLKFHEDCKDDIGLLLFIQKIQNNELRKAGQRTVYTERSNFQFIR